MKDEFVNRLAMFQTCLGTLNSPEHKPTWFNQPPIAITTKVGQAVTAVADLEAFLAQYGADITGAAADKRREEQELEVAAYRLGSALAVWFRDHNDETNAAKVDSPLSGWRRLRGQTLLEAARLSRSSSSSQ